jgi:uncharacterized protein
MQKETTASTATIRNSSDTAPLAPNLCMAVPPSMGPSAHAPIASTCPILVTLASMPAQPGRRPALLGSGWNPAPFREFIVKIHARCDLSCDYCYMFEMADQSWRSQPRAMSEEIAELAAMRMGEHARSHGLTRIALILHARRAVDAADPPLSPQHREIAQRLAWPR